MRSGKRAAEECSCAHECAVSEMSPQSDNLNCSHCDIYAEGFFLLLHLWYKDGHRSKVTNELHHPKR